MLWVIDPSLRHPETQGVEQILDGWTGERRLFQPALENGDGPGPDAGYDFDGLVLMGSGASVYESRPWMSALEQWLRPLLDGRVRKPVLGICFGHQLIAHVAGAKVGFLRPDRAKRVGVETSELDGGRLLPGPRSLRVVVSHREEVKTRPEGYRVVARRGPVEIDGLEHEELPVFAYQFHPEAREEFAERAGIDLTEIDSALRRDSGGVLAAFRDRVRGS